MEIAKDTLSEKEAADFVIALESKINNADASQLKTIEEKIQKAAKEMAESLKIVALVDKRNAMFSHQAVNRGVKAAERVPAKPFDGLLAFLEDDRASYEGAGRGINAIVEGYKTKYLGELKSRLTKAGVFDEFRKDQLVKEIFQEFYEPGSSGSAKAKTIRDIMFALKQDAVEKQNSYGSMIRFLEEHVKRQVYSPLLIKKNFGPQRFKNLINLKRFLTPDEWEQTFQAWAKFMIPLIDSERTFKDSDPMDFLKGAFEGIMSGKHGPIQPASGAEINVAFNRIGSLAKRASQQRLIHFKDGESAYKAYSMLSDEPLSKGFVVELEHAATNIALMQQLGPNPKAALEEIIKRLEAKYTHAGEEAKLKNLQENKYRLFSALSFLDRSAQRPENPTMGSATASVISLLSQAKLGKILFFALPDKALIQSVLTRNGVRGMEALRESLRITRPGNLDERLRLMMLGGELKSFLNTVNSRFSTGAETGVPSLIHTSQKWFFNATGINWLDDVGTDAIVGTLSRHLGVMADRPFNAIPSEMQRVFKQYDISPLEWDAWRSTVYSILPNGEARPGIHGTDAWVTPDQFALISDEVIDGLLKERGVKITDNNRMRQRDLLESKFRTWLTAQRDEGVLMPGSKEHRLATFGTQAGTGLGSMMRLIMMFKTFPITVYTKIMKREMFGNGATGMLDWIKQEKNSKFHTTQLIALSTIAGYLSLMIDEALQGKEPRKFTKSDGQIDSDATVKILKDSFLRGNAASMFGDLILREYDTGYNNVLSQLGGPFVNETIRGVSMASHTLHGEAKPKEYVDFLRRNTPWVNLFYIKPALEHLVWFNIQEMLDPGSLKEMELKQKQTYNQDYWLPPSDVNKELHAR